MMSEAAIAAGGVEAEIVGMEIEQEAEEEQEEEEEEEEEALLFPIDLEFYFGSNVPTGTQGDEEETVGHGPVIDQESIKHTSGLFVFLHDLYESEVCRILREIEGLAGTTGGVEGFLDDVSNALQCMECPDALITNARRSLVLEPIKEWCLDILRSDLMPKLLSLNRVRLGSSKYPLHARALSEMQIALIVELAEACHRLPLAQLVDFFQNVVDLGELSFGSDEQFQFAHVLYESFLAPDTLKAMVLPMRLVRDIHDALDKERVALDAFEQAQRLTLEYVYRTVVAGVLERAGVAPSVFEAKRILEHDVHSALFLSFAQSVHNDTNTRLFFELQRFLAEPTYAALFRITKVYLDEEQGFFSLPKAWHIELQRWMDDKPGFVDRSLAPARRLLEQLAVFNLAVIEVEMIPTFRAHHFYAMTKPENNKQERRQSTLSSMRPSVSYYASQSEAALATHEDEKLQQERRSSIASYYSGRMSAASYYGGGEVRGGGETPTNDMQHQESARPRGAGPRGSIMLSLTEAAVARSKAMPPKATAAAIDTPLVAVTDYQFDFDAAVKSRYRGMTADLVRRPLKGVGAVRVSITKRDLPSSEEDFAAIKRDVQRGFAARKEVLDKLAASARIASSKSVRARTASIMDHPDLLQQLAQQPDFGANIRRRTVIIEESKNAGDDKSSIDHSQPKKGVRFSYDGEDSESRAPWAPGRGIMKKTRFETLEEALQRIYRERLAESDRLLAILAEGALLKKYNTMHTSDKRWFEVSADGTEISWEKSVLPAVASGKGGVGGVSVGGSGGGRGHSHSASGWFSSLVKNKKIRELGEVLEVKYGTWWSRRFQRYNMRNK